MAEFKEVIRQALRMNEARAKARDRKPDHISLLISSENNVYFENGDKVDSVEEIERFIMGWAAEHPEPAYPTWMEWHDTTFADSEAKEVPCPKYFLDQMRGEIMCAESDECPDCWNTPIPADIAEKLGVKPIEGGK